MRLLQHDLTTDQILSGWREGFWTTSGYLALLLSALMRDRGSVCIEDIPEFCELWEINLRTFYRAKSALISSGIIVESPIQSIQIKPGDGVPIPEPDRSLGLSVAKDREVDTKGRPSTSQWKSLKAQVFKRDDYKCQYCGIKPKKLHCDHVVPISRGGNNELSNFITSCPSCNLSKSSKTLSEWLEVSNEVV